MEVRSQISKLIEDAIRDGKGISEVSSQIAKLVEQWYERGLATGSLIESATWGNYRDG